MKKFQHSYSRTPAALTEIPIPNLIELQRDSYEWFLREGLRELFQSFSPIYDFTGNISLELLDYTLGEPKYSIEECRDRDMTYEAPVKAKVRLSESGKEVIESETGFSSVPSISWTLPSTIWRTLTFLPTDLFRMVSGLITSYW